MLASSLSGAAARGVVRSGRLMPGGRGSIGSRASRAFVHAKPRASDIRFARSEHRAAPAVEAERRPWFIVDPTSQAKVLWDVWVSLLIFYRCAS
jgi:hypothetical protein